MKNISSIKYGIYILIISGVVSFLLIKFKPKPIKSDITLTALPVNYVTAKAKKTQIILESEGILKPKIETNLIAEVSGSVTKVGEKFYPGKYIEKGDMLFQIDPSDYYDRLKIAEFDLAQAELFLEEQEALAAQAISDWENFDYGEPNDLVLRKPQLKQAQARLSSSIAAVDTAKRNLNKTTVRAPFSGYLLDRSVDLGSYVSGSLFNGRGHAKMYATGDGEIRLSIDASEKQFLNINNDEPLEIKFFHPKSEKPIAFGTVDRVEATLNNQNRLSYCVGLIPSAFPHPDLIPNSPNNEAQKLERNQYLVAEIKGSMLKSAFTIPDTALRQGLYLYIISNEDRLNRKKIKIAHKTPKSIIITEGLKEGDRIVTSPIAYFSEGMLVEPSPIQ